METVIAMTGTWPDYTSERQQRPTACQQGSEFKAMVKSSDPDACPHLLSGGTWADCEAGGLHMEEKEEGK